MTKTLIDRHVVVRSSPSGVWFGVLAAAEGSTVALRSARRAWSWEGAGSCSSLATRGPSGGRIEGPVDLAIVGEVCEILSASDAAIVRWAEVPVWAP